MNRLLLLMKTHTYRAGAFLDAAEKLGVPVVIGSEQVHVMAAIQPDRHLALDFQDLETATDTVVEFAREHPLSAILAPEDDGVLLAAMASDALQLSNNQVQAVAAARNKYLMRQVLEGAGLATPWCRRFPVTADPAEIAGQVPYPNVVKPLSLSGSRGVIRTDNPPEFHAAFARVAGILSQPEVGAQQGVMAQFILVETYIPGIEVAVEGLLTAGQLQVLTVFDKPDPLEGPFFEETIYVTPSRLPAQHQEALIDAVAAGAEALGITDGPVHAELRLNNDGIWLIEIAPRSIGGHCAGALRFEKGESLETLILRQALGQDVTGLKRENTAAGVMMIPIPQAGELQQILGQEHAKAVPGVDEILLTIPIGQRVLPPPEGNQYLGFIFARAKSPAAVEAALRAAHARLEFIISPVDGLK
jgi:biotin carboxylase